MIRHHYLALVPERLRHAAVHDPASIDDEDFIKFLTFRPSRAHAGIFTHQADPRLPAVVAATKTKARIFDHHTDLQWTKWLNMVDGLETTERGSTLIMVYAASVRGADGKLSLRTLPFSQDIYVKMKQVLCLSGMRILQLPGTSGVDLPSQAEMDSWPRDKPLVLNALRPLCHAQWATPTALTVVFEPKRMTTNAVWWGHTDDRDEFRAVKRISREQMLHTHPLAMLAVLTLVESAQEKTLMKKWSKKMAKAFKDCNIRTLRELSESTCKSATGLMQWRNCLQDLVDFSTVLEMKRYLRDPKLETPGSASMLRMMDRSSWRFRKVLSFEIEELMDRVRILDEGYADINRLLKEGSRLGFPATN